MPHAVLDNRARIGVSGPEAGHFLHNLLTTDIEGLGEAVWMPGALLSAQGKVLFTFLVMRDGEGFLLETASADAEDFLKRLKFYRLRAKVELAGPQPVHVAVSWGEGLQSGARDGRFAEPVWRSATSSAAAGLDSWTLTRIRNGVAEPVLDYAYADVFPHDINLDQTGGVSFKKGCYVGQEVVSRMQHRGTARRRLMVATGADALSSGAPVQAGARTAGVLGSVCGQTGLALVRLDRVSSALGEGAALLAGDVAVSLSFPDNVRYGWPEPAGAED